MLQLLHRNLFGGVHWQNDGIQQEKEQAISHFLSIGHSGPEGGSNALARQSTSFLTPGFDS
jgi:hypothetical protein